jgi:hypothetical protein
MCTPQIYYYSLTVLTNRMNHTFKGILIVVVITSILVLGATTTMFPIMQKSFAHKKSDFKKEGDPNTNTNTNTATSDSDSTATASNTNNINNTATASNSQEQSACAVALTCPEGSTTVTPPTTGTLIITKICNPAGSFATCEATTFPITVTDNNPQPSSFSLGHEESQTVTLGPGSFTVHESVPADFEPPGFTGDCVETARRSPDATGTISAGETLHCTITNTVGPG